MVNLMANARFHTLGEILRWRAEAQPDFPLYTYLTDGETQAVQLTLGELDRAARAIAATLQTMTKKGDRALLLYPSGLEFIAAFFGCLYAGVLAAPTSPPRANRPDQRLLAIAHDAEPTVVLTTTELLQKSEGGPALAQALSAKRWLATDSLPLHLAAQWQETALSWEDPAFLQYTSGSTGQPKGVMVSHGNLLHNEQMIAEAFGHDETTDETTVVAGWLPFFHDMGLVGNLLQPLYIGRPVVLMAPTAFLQKPIRWLQMITRYRATTSGGPNFAYDLCVQKTTPEQRAGLDLSGWTVAFNGAEPIRAATLQRFARQFAPFGFRIESLYPCYGMAEATLLITGAVKTAPPKLQPVLASLLEQNGVRLTSPDMDDARILVGCGQIRAGVDVRIVDPEREVELDAGKVGEIWVASPSVAQGYWRQPEATAATFQATLATTGEGPFLRTGDLGFIKHNELYITGRLKDLIIIRGRNHYPQDIEATVAASHPALHMGSGAAFTAELAGAERLVVVQEVDRTALRHLNPAEIVRAIRTAVTQEHGLQVQMIVLLRPLSIPKTSSGKIQRHLCRKKLLTQELEVVEEWTLFPTAQSTPKEEWRENEVAGSRAGLGPSMVAVLQAKPDELDLF